jgi:zinc protease
MKKLFTLLLAICIATVSFGQSMLLNPQDPIKLDSLVKVGHLDNGLTYIIRHNANPEHRAEFYIATNVGAINETPAQRGLAHFLEHMCFNGNKDFPGNTMMSYLEKKGLIFGANINAMTGVEQTVYVLQTIPTDSKAMIDTALVILQNDAHFVKNDPAEIEKERGVILEEWRSGNSAQRRQAESQFKVLYKGTKYADCNVIGDDKCIQGFDPKELVSFYQTWYYPANQAIIVVGDVDVNYVENKIKELFNVIPKKENTPVKETIKVPDNTEPLVNVFSDPETGATSVNIIIKQEPIPAKYKALGLYKAVNLSKDLMVSMLNERFSDAAKEPGSVFSAAGADYVQLVTVMDGAYFYAMPKEGNGLATVKELVKLIRQAGQYGFTQDELDRAKTNLLRGYQSAADKAATRTNGQLAIQYVNYFLEQEPYVDPVYENEVVKQYVPQITLQQLNMMIKSLITKENNIILYTCPKKDGVHVPTDAEVLSSYNDGYAAEVKPIAANAVNEPLLNASAVKGGKVKKEEAGFAGSKTWTLSNGLKVHLYPTDVQKDAIQFRLEQKGGKSILPMEVLPSFEENVIAFYQQNAGVSKFSQSKLDKILAGKNVSVGNTVGPLTSGIVGSGSTKDFETMMQLAYLYYTEPRCDAAEFENSMSQMKSIASNLGSNPDFRFSEENERVLNNNSPRFFFFGKDLLDKVSAANIKKGLDMLFSDAAGSEIYIAGDFKPEVIKPFVEKYLGALPVKSKVARKFVNHNMYMAPGMHEDVFEFDMKNPQTSAAIYYTGPIQNTKDNTIQLKAMTYILEMRYIASLREENGGTYSPSVEGYISLGANERYNFNITFQTQYEKSKGLIEKVHKGIEDLAANGPTNEELTKTIESFKKNIPENKKRISYFMNLIEEYYSWGKDMTDSDALINKNVTKDTVQKMAQLLVNNKNRSEIIMNPKGK